MDQEEMIGVPPQSASPPEAGPLDHAPQERATAGARRRSPVRYLLAGALFGVSFLLYLSTLAPTVVTLFDDSLEFQLVTYQLGIAHPTGYPLYTLLGRLFTFLPVGDVAYRVNLMSALFGAATVSLLYLLVLQMAPARPDSRMLATVRSPGWPLHVGGMVGALLLAVSLIFWQQATIAEVYTLNAFFVVLLLVIATSSPRATDFGAGLPFRPVPGPPPDHDFAAAGFAALSFKLPRPAR
jgi:hypothetical protein